MPVFASSSSIKLLDSLKSIGIEFGHSSLPFNGESSPSSCTIKWSTSSAPESIHVSFTSKEETYEISESNDPNCHSNLECKVKTSCIEDFNPNYSDRHDPSVCEIKELESKAHDSSSRETEILASNHASFVVDFDTKEFEDHLKAATSYLKDNFRYFSSTSRTLSIEDSTFSSFLRVENSIKVACVALDKKKMKSFILILRIQRKFSKLQTTKPKL